MARTNITTTRPRPLTHEGAPAFMHLSPLMQLRRSVMSCLLWEGEFYEDGQSIAERITALSAQVSLEELSATAIEARQTMGLRHVPLILAVALAQRLAKMEARPAAAPALVATTVANVVGRVDELTELVSLYWRLNPDKMLSRQVRRGLAQAFGKFDRHQFSKYDHDKGKAVKLRDVLRLTRPVPADEVRSKLYKDIRTEALEAPDTWEVALMRGEDKRATFERLLSEDRLGYLALLRNIRKMDEVGVPQEVVDAAILRRRGSRNVWPHRYVAAARAAPRHEPALDAALVAAIAEAPQLPGRTIVLVDVSGSMSQPLSSRSDLTRMDAAATLAGIIPAPSLRIFSFSNATVEVPPRRGMACVDAVTRSQSNQGTYMGAAVAHMNTIEHDRLIVVTDEQSHDPVPDPVAKHAYLVNVASAKNGVGYGRWTHFDGFSEAVLRFIHEAEAASYT